MEWMVNINKLTAEQRNFFENEFDPRLSKNKNYWIQGPVGSGKTVVLVHTINQVFRFNPNVDACIVVFTHALIDLLRTGLSDEIKAKIPIMTYFNFVNKKKKYDIIFVDEVQDIRSDILSKLKEATKHLIVAGDISQSIYDDGCPPNLISNLTGTFPYQLRAIHRLTPKIIQMASIFTQDPNALLSAPRGRLANVDVVKYIFNNIFYEVKFVYSKAKEFAEQGYSTAILIPSHNDIIKFFDIVCINENINVFDWSKFVKNKNYNLFNDYMRSNNLPIQYLGNGFGSLQKSYDKSLINVMTYHSSKGLDFQAVFLPFLSDSLEIWRSDNNLERTLFFVALTRCRQNLFLSYSNSPHSLLKEIPENLLVTRYYSEFNADDSVEDNFDEDDSDMITFEDNEFEESDFEDDEFEDDEFEDDEFEDDEFEDDEFEDDELNNNTLNDDDIPF